MNDSITLFASNQGMGDWGRIVVSELPGGVRVVQGFFSVNGEEYVINTNVVQTSVKGAELAVEILTLLFQKPGGNVNQGS